jgi:hypothetical protein
MRRELPIRVVARSMTCLAVMMLLIVPVGVVSAGPLASPVEVVDPVPTEKAEQLSERARKRLRARARELRAALEDARRTVSRERSEKSHTAAGDRPTPITPRAASDASDVANPTPRPPNRTRSSARVALQSVGSSISRPWSALVLQPLAAPVLRLLSEAGPPMIASGVRAPRLGTRYESARPSTDPPGLVLAVMVSLMGLGVVLGRTRQAALPTRTWVNTRLRKP